MGVEDDGIVVTRRLTIPARELRWRFTGSGGPGGQHANTSNTKVDLRWDVAASEALDDGQRRRLLARLGAEVRVVEAGERSQSRNRAAAARRMGQVVREALRVSPRRVPTRPGRGAVERRLGEKRRRAERKRSRRGEGWD
ncbi:alternative ribosome rescue aminoacyl-tRNA hydrolase ArfB [Actinomarinicola tropica]|uniref:Aminoacyl-tRNA hydrolase n=1 Tax=Actinomarinicola tropica TaxID=2789776 RepID=A0A5Q2REV5_9ACTN|nr:alternative ribosome rescue aminoacyl-tRNA hydrolase ArfB [Actinomarinicola tropica]QGG95388.1 aminoacyl-tRNA hydrolase [Actinomarinicola tropica]